MSVKGVPLTLAIKCLEGHLRLEQAATLRLSFCHETIKVMHILCFAQ